jgi:hypothetical protein
MADDTPNAAEGQVQSLGETTRISPNPTGEPNPTLEQTADEQALANETPEEKAAREAAAAETPEAKATREAAEAADKDKPAEGVDFKGTVFEGLSPEMQGKVAPYAAAFAENGTLTDAEVSEAAKATGFSEAAVRQFMAGATATASAEGKVITDAFGGDAQFREFQGWSREEGNLTASEEKVINKALEGGDYETAAELMKAPMERWKAAGGGAAPRDVTDNPQGRGGETTGDVYESWAQLVTDQSKPEYRNDPAFRKKVEAKTRTKPGPRLSLATPSPKGNLRGSYPDDQPSRDIKEK